MRTEEFIQVISKQAGDNARFEELKNGIPLGVDVNGEIVLAQKSEKTYTVRHTCVTGSNKTQFIRRLLLTLACIHDEKEACFIVLSPSVEYGELLRLTKSDFTIPYIRTKEDLVPAVKALRELIYMPKNIPGQPAKILRPSSMPQITSTLETPINISNIALYSARSKFPFPSSNPSKPSKTKNKRG